jgi:hypothetical protein
MDPKTKLLEKQVKQLESIDGRLIDACRSHYSMLGMAVIGVCAAPILGLLYWWNSTTAGWESLLLLYTCGIGAVVFTRVKANRLWRAFRDALYKLESAGFIIYRVDAVIGHGLRVGEELPTDEPVIVYHTEDLKRVMSFYAEYVRGPRSSANAIKNATVPKKPALRTR